MSEIDNICIGKKYLKNGKVEEFTYGGVFGLSTRTDMPTITKEKFKRIWQKDLDEVLPKFPDVQKFVVESIELL